MYGLGVLTREFKNASQGCRKHLKLGGGRHFEATFSLRKRGHSLEIEPALLCLLQNLRGARAPSVPGSYIYDASLLVYGVTLECTILVVGTVLIFSKLHNCIP